MGKGLELKQYTVQIADKPGRGRKKTVDSMLRKVAESGVLGREEGKSYNGENGQDGKGEVRPSLDSALWGNKERAGISRDGSVEDKQGCSRIGLHVVLVCLLL